MDGFHICLILCLRTACTKVIILDTEVVRLYHGFFLFWFQIWLEFSLISKQFIFSGNIIASGFQTPEHIGSWCIADCIKIIIGIFREIFCMVG